MCFTLSQTGKSQGLKNMYDWYLIPTIPTAIFLKVHAHYRHEVVFSWKCSRPRGDAHYTTLNTVVSIKCGYWNNWIFWIILIIVLFQKFRLSFLHFTDHSPWKCIKTFQNIMKNAVIFKIVRNVTNCYNTYIKIWCNF